MADLYGSGLCPTCAVGDCKRREEHRAANARVVECIYYRSTGRRIRRGEFLPSPVNRPRFIAKSRCRA